MMDGMNLYKSNVLDENQSKDKNESIKNIILYYQLWNTATTKLYFY